MTTKKKVVAYSQSSMVITLLSLTVLTEGMNDG
jgi:hypothetical protein